jgi:hypothetical protein
MQVYTPHSPLKYFASSALKIAKFAIIIQLLELLFARLVTQHKASILTLCAYRLHALQAKHTHKHLDFAFHALQDAQAAHKIAPMASNAAHAPLPIV